MQSANIRPQSLAWKFAANFHQSGHGIQRMRSSPSVSLTCFSVAASGIISFLTGFVYLSQSGLLEVKPLKAYGRFSNPADIPTHAA
jgi:hypothetical protein